MGKLADTCEQQDGSDLPLDKRGSQEVIPVKAERYQEGECREPKHPRGGVAPCPYDCPESAKPKHSDGDSEHEENPTHPGRAGQLHEFHDDASEEQDSDW
jgi:hypothetical protein